MPIHILIQQIPKPSGPTRITRLGTKRPQPHKIARLDLDPVLIEAVDGLALEDVQPVLHDVRLGKGDDAAGRKGHNVDVHVVAQVGRVDEAGGGPGAVGAGHGGRAHIPLVGDEGIRGG